MHAQQRQRQGSDNATAKALGGRRRGTCVTALLIAAMIARLAAEALNFFLALPRCTSVRFDRPLQQQPEGAHARAHCVVPQRQGLPCLRAPEAKPPPPVGVRPSSCTARCCALASGHMLVIVCCVSKCCILASRCLLLSARCAAPHCNHNLHSVQPTLPAPVLHACQTHFATCV